MSKNNFYVLFVGTIIGTMIFGSGVSEVSAASSGFSTIVHVSQAGKVCVHSAKEDLGCKTANGPSAIKFTFKKGSVRIGTQYTACINDFCQTGINTPKDGPEDIFLNSSGINEVSKVTLFVPATSGDSASSTWSDSGLELSGNKVTVVATGTGYNCPGCSSTPNGPPAGSQFAGQPPGKCPSCTFPSAPVGALIAKIGDGNPVLVGAGPTELTGTGQVYFAFNDGYGDHADNSGGYSVTVSGTGAANQVSSASTDLEQAKSAIKARFDDANMRGLKLVPFGDVTAGSKAGGYFQVFTDADGNIFAQFWTKQNGAHWIYGGILTKYRQMGLERSELGYPVTDELPIPGSKTGRYNKFENGKYLVWTPEAGTILSAELAEPKSGAPQNANTNAQNANTQNANTNAQNKQPKPVEHKEKKFEVTFYAINSVQCHDLDCTNDQVPDDDCAKWDMYGSVNGKMTVLMSSACMPGGLAFRDNPGKWYALSPSLVNRFSEIQAPAAVFNNVQANLLGPFTLTVAVPDNGHFTIQTGGRERDRAGDGDASPYFDMVKSSNTKMQDYIRTKYLPSHPNVGLDTAYYDVVTGAELMNKIANNPSAAAAEFANEAKNLLPELSGLSDEQVNKYLEGVDIVQNVIQNPEEAVKKYGQEVVSAAISEVGAQIPGPVGSFVSALDVNRLINDPSGYIKDTAKDLAIEVAVAYGAQAIPGLGQVYAIGYALYKAFDFLSGANPDDGIGIISETCSAQNNFCVGTHAYKSKFNGADNDSTGDFWMAINVKEI